MPVFPWSRLLRLLALVAFPFAACPASAWTPCHELSTVPFRRASCDCRSRKQSVRRDVFRHHLAANDKSGDTLVEISNGLEKEDGVRRGAEEEVSIPKESDPLRRQPPMQRPGPSAKDLMRAMGTSPRRLFTGTASAVGIALAGNFLGVTSQLLTLIPEETLEPTGIDTYFPRGDYRRIKGKGYAFVIPKEWVGDTFLELAKAERATRPLDYNMRHGGSSVTLPDAAFGPPGRLNPRTGVSEEGDTNVSVIVSDIMSGFSLKGTLGSPAAAAEKLIRSSLAPEGSDRTITLRRALEDSNRHVYQLDYDVDRGNGRLPTLRAISVIAAGSPVGTTLITLTVTAPKQVWEGDAIMATKLERIASSFHTT